MNSSYFSASLDSSHTMSSVASRGAVGERTFSKTKKFIDFIDELFEDES